MTGLQLPSIGPDVVHAYRLSGESRISAPLAIAMIELGMITDEDVSARRVPDEKQLAEAALTRWWNNQTAKLKIFTWELHAQTFDHELFRFHSHEHAADTWFCITQNGDIPQFTLALQIKRLEAQLEGFGQTVMAVLQDAFNYLPESFTPARTLYMAQSYHWYGEVDEEAWIKTQIGLHGEFKTREELLENFEVFTLAEFYKNMPEWLPHAKRMKSRRQLQHAAESTLARNVIKACDHIWSYVTAPEFALKRFQAGVGPLGFESLTGCVLLRWSEADITIRILDDYMNDIGESGEYCELLSACPVALTADDLRVYFRNVEQMIELAARVETLLQLVCTPN